MSHGVPENYGWVPDPALAESLAEDSIARHGATSLDDLPVNLDKPAIIYRAAARVLAGNRRYIDNHGLLLALSQGGHGSCIGFGQARMILMTLAAGKYMRGLEIDWPTDANGLPISISPSWCYGAARTAANNLGRWEGASAAGAAKATEEMGWVWEKQYDNFDIRTYREEDCNTWEAQGVPKVSLAYADDNLLKGRMRLTHVNQAVALCQAGYAFNITGPGKPDGVTRGEYGELYSGNRRWSHSMTGGICYVVYKIRPGKVFRGLGILNSHGSKKYKGPKGALTGDLPDGAYISPLNEVQEAIDRRDCWCNFELDGLRPAQRNWERKVAA